MAHFGLAAVALHGLEAEHRGAWMRCFGCPWQLDVDDMRGELACGNGHSDPWCATWMGSSRNTARALFNIGYTHMS